MENFIPLDKSWMIRIGVLDLFNHYPDILQILAKEKDLSDDLQALKRVCEIWNTNEPCDVGESATLLRFFRLLSWREKRSKAFVLRGSLKHRRIADDSRIVSLTQAQALDVRGMLGIDEEPTTQWASGLVLLGDRTRLLKAPFKLQLTYHAVDHWRQRREQGRRWDIREDETIRKQAETFLLLMQRQRPNFIPEQAEDYCFARAFGYIRREEGARRWPNLRGHESNRLEEMENILDAVKEDRLIASRDHRVIQAAVMWAVVQCKEYHVQYPEAVSKSWPRFWDFVASAMKKLYDYS